MILIRVVLSQYIKVSDHIGTALLFFIKYMKKQMFKCKNL